MTDTIQDKIRQKTTNIFKNNLEIMAEFGILNNEQVQVITRIFDDFKWGNKKLKLDTLDIYFRYNPELFDKEFLDKIGNPKPYKPTNSEK